MAARSAGARTLRLVPAALTCAGLVLALYLKNQLIFGQFTTSSWLGMNLAKVVLPHVPERERSELARSGVISAAALVEPFSPLELYEPLPPLPPAFADIPALSARTKQNGQGNLNHVAYIAVGRRLLHDSVTLIQLRPRAYLRGVGRALSTYLESNGECLGLKANERPLARWRAVYEPLLYGRITTRDAGQPRFVYPLLSLAISSITLLLVWLATSRAGNLTQRWLLRFVLWCVVYVGAVSNGLDLGENARFRYAVDPLYLVAACAAWQLLSARQFLAPAAPQLARP
jgi:hypothetical protein